jgi:hypothetical protein
LAAVTLHEGARSSGMNTYPVMLPDYHPGFGEDGAWSFSANGLPAEGDEILITRSSALPEDDSMVVSVKAVSEEAPFTITATLLS